jgi:hypothetical protein
MAHIVGYTPEDGEVVYVNLDQIVTIAPHPDGGCTISFATGKGLRVKTDPKLIAEHSRVRF